MDKMAKVIVTGDTCPVYRLEDKMMNESPSSILGEFHGILKAGDFVITNLEAPLTNHTNSIPKTGPALKASPGCLQFFEKTPFNLLTLANNHIMDYGFHGFEETIENIKSTDLSYVGGGLTEEEAYEPCVKQIEENFTIAVLNFAENEWSTIPGSHGTLVNKVDPIQNYYQILESKRYYDKVLVITHGGIENYPLPSPELKKRLRFYVNAGADAVINHHTHSISGFEEYKGKPIYYSLGNFLFDYTKTSNQNWFEGMAVELSFSKDKERVDHNYYTFDQCKKAPVLNLHQGKKKIELEEQIKNLNDTINDDNQLQLAFNDFCKHKQHLYKSYLKPYTNKYFHYLRKKGLLPSFLNSKKKRLLLNITRCESHRELLHNILINEDRNT
jgi:poly-gamma-glutamate synthesis protein (capsule biosynthesis protein)